MKIPDESPIFIQDLISYQVAILAQTIGKAVNEELERDFGVGVTENRILSIVAQNQSSSIRQITDLTKTDKGWVSRSVNNLLTKGLLTKFQDENDARRVQLTLTDAGQRLQKKLFAESIRRHRFLLETFSAGEQAMLIELLKRLQGRAELLLQQADEN